MFFDLEIL